MLLVQKVNPFKTIPINAITITVIMFISLVMFNKCSCVDNLIIWHSGS